MAIPESMRHIAIATNNQIQHAYLNSTSRSDGDALPANCLTAKYKPAPTMSADAMRPATGASQKTKNWP